MGRVPPPSQPRGLRTLRPWQPALSQAASSQRCPGSSACKFQCIARRRREGGCPGSKKIKQSLYPGRAPLRPVTSPTGCPASLAWGAAQRGGTHPPRPRRCRSLWELLSPELSECKKDGGAYRETTHSSVWQPSGDSGSSALKEEEEEEGTAQSDAICCTPLRCHWLPGASPGTAGLGPLGATSRLTAPSSCSPPPLPSSSSPPQSPPPLFPSGALTRPSTRPPPP